MKIIDPKLTHSLKNYVFQSILATTFIFLVLVFLDILEHTALIATLGASAFIVFVMPNSYISRPAQVLGGYVVGMVCGCSCFLLMTGMSRLLDGVPARVFLVCFGAATVGVAIFLMAATDYEHPPAVGVALGLVLNRWDHQTIIFIVFAVILMLVIKKLLQPFLIDLV